MKVDDRGIARFDINDDADLKVLVANGLIWKGGSKAVGAGFRYLQAHPDEVNALVPPYVAAALRSGEQPVPQPAEQAEPAEQETPAEDATEPGEEPPVAPA